MLALRTTSNRPALALKAGQRRTGTTPARSRPGTLQVVAFRENKDWASRFRQDYKDQTSIGTDFRKGAKQAQVRGKQAAKQAKTNLKSSGNQVYRGVRSGDLEEPVANNSTIYSINAVALATAAGIAAYNPGLAAEVGFLHSFLTSPASAGPLLLAPLYQILSLGLSAAAITNYVQSGGAQTDTLDSDVHKRLNASLSTFSVAQLALLSLNLTPLSKSILGGFNGLDALNPTGIALLGTGCLLQLYVAGINYARNAPEGYNPVADAKSWLNDAVNTFSGVNGSFSAGYALLTAALLGAGLGYIVAPGLTLQGVFGASAPNGGGPDAIVLWQLIGAGVSMIVAPAAYSLKEAVMNNELSDVRYKLLNVALFTAGLGHWLVLYPRVSTAGPLTPVVLGTWALAALLGGSNVLQGRERDYDG